MSAFFLFHEAQSDQDRISRRLSLFDEEPLGIIATTSTFNAEKPSRGIASRDAQGRTPVERLLSDDESQR